jgi:hypothetical protein
MLTEDNNMFKRILITMTLLMAASTAAFAQTNSTATNSTAPNNTIYTDSKTSSDVRTTGSMSTTITQPPPSAISPQFNAGNNSDLCTIGVAGAVQTQILGISAGTTFTEENCIRLKNAKVMYDMGMKVAAVSVMCQDKKVFAAMMHAGTPCPYNGKIGAEAKLGWDSHVETTKEELKKSGGLDAKTKASFGIGGLLALLLLF